MRAMPGVRPDAPSMSAEATTASAVIIPIVHAVKCTYHVTPTRAPRTSRSMRYAPTSLDAGAWAKGVFVVSAITGLPSKQTRRDPRR